MVSPWKLIKSSWDPSHPNSWLSPFRQFAAVSQVENRVIWNRDKVMCVLQVCGLVSLASVLKLQFWWFYASESFFVCLYSGVEPLGSEWSSEALLWFQSVMVGEPLSARIFSVTERGYCVELESRGRNVAAALISEKLAKVSGQIIKETPAAASPSAAPQESTKGNEQNQIHAQDSKASAKNPPSEGGRSEGQLESQSSWDKIRVKVLCCFWCWVEMIPSFQCHLSQWTGRRWSCPSARHSRCSFSLWPVLHSSTWLAPVQVRPDSYVPVCHKW